MLLIGKVASSNNIPPNTDNNYLHRLHDAIVGSDASQAEISACRATSFRSRACDDVEEDGEGGAKRNVQQSSAVCRFTIVDYRADAATKVVYKIRSFEGNYIYIVT